MHRTPVAWIWFWMTAAPALLLAQPSIVLPAPHTDGGKPLMQALALRQSTRAFSQAALTPQQLSDLLWAADGVNRKDAGKRTAPSANNAQEIDIYVLLREGTYVYRPATHTLDPAAAKDFRPAAGRQDFVATAPLNLVYVADVSKMKTTDEQDRILYSAADAGCIAQNVYLFCASEGLGAVVRGWVDREALGKALALNASQRIILAQTIGSRAE